MDDSLVKSLFGVAEYIYKIWKGIPKTQILNQEATINVPESIVDYTLAVRIPPNFRSVRKTIDINAPSIVRMSASTLSPFPRTVRDATKAFQDNEGHISYVLLPELLPPDSELISLSVSYNVADVSLFDDLVERTKAHEPSGPNSNEYWMHAQLKHPKVLTDKFGRFDLRDIDVTVDVGVHNELKTTIPPSFVRRLKTFFEIMSETDPRQQFKAIPQLRHLAQEKTAGKEFQILSDLESLFLPRAFSKYVEVLKDFRYSTCYKGKESYDLPIEIIPKKMEVVSRTDLTLDEPAKSGILIYKSNLFIDAIRNILSNK